MEDSENNYIKTNKIPGYNELVESIEELSDDITNKADKVIVVAQTSSATIAPNTYNVWTNVSNDLTITKGTDIPGIVNEYMIRFTLASSWVTDTNVITFSGWALEWNGGSVPTWTSEHIYEISIIDNIALWVDITPAS